MTFSTKYPGPSFGGRPWTALLLAMLLIFSNCGKESDKIPDGKILARVGDTIITVDEFRRRADYTIRPMYCNGENYIHRKIILNSLIAEKLLALEAGESNELTGSEQFRDYIQGREEQSLRQWLFYHDFYDCVALDTADIRAKYKAAAREYTIEYVSLKDSAIAGEIGRQLLAGDTFENVFAALDSLPQRKVTWESPEHEKIHAALFSGLLPKGRIIGPLKIERDFYMVMRVAGYSDVHYLTDFDIRNRYRDVQERMTLDAAVESYAQFVQSVMKGKRIDFNRDTFRKLVNLIGPLYLAASNRNEDAFAGQIWRKETEEVSLDSVSTDIDKMGEETLLKIDDDVWTVARFKKELNIHPLVFRKKQMKKGEFSEQFKYAVADMIRDKYLANEARRKGYDRAFAVSNNVAMWRDHLMGLYRRNEFLAERGKLASFQKNYLTILDHDVNPYIRELFQKYSNQIQINTALFERTELSRIDMVALQTNVPFPVVVPNFPIVTTHDKLDYGSQMTGTK
ncbi:MAG: hypothetical protein ACOY90_21720 [Candidatus Zhuqueibacterota bacterium]